MDRIEPYGSGKIKWVSTEWLNVRLNEEGMIIVDVQPNIHDYTRGSFQAVPVL